jgi:hypothetical protein
VPRKKSAVAARIREGLHALRVLTYHSRWTRQELGLLRRHARALARKYYRDAHRAAAACHAELMRRHQAQPRDYAPRPLMSVTGRLGELAREFGWRGTFSQFHPAEERLFERFTQRSVRRRFASGHKAAAACHVEFNRLQERLPDSRPMALRTIELYLQKRAWRIVGRRRGSR